MACSICKRANVFNMSVEGVMMFSCFFAVAISYKTGSWRWLSAFCSAWRCLAPAS